MYIFRKESQYFALFALPKTKNVEKLGGYNFAEDTNLLSPISLTIAKKPQKLNILSFDHF